MLRQDPEIDLDFARDILRYFLHNPQAVDDLEGVARWRLLDQRIHRTVEKASQALTWLVSRGWVVREQAGTSSPTFRLNAAQRVDIEKFLEEVEAQKNDAHQE